MSFPVRALALGSLLVLACSDDPGGQPAADAGAPDAEAPDAEPPPPTFAGVDVLFVVNDSGGMVGLQTRVGAALPAFFDAIEAAEGAALDLHVGVVSTSVSTPSPALCAGGPPGGDLEPRGCVTTGAFASSTDANFATTIGDAAACMVTLGEFGCPFEQPFEAMRRALDGSRAGNAGFLRDDALLVVVFVTDEDDCSSSVNELYVSGAPYGPFGSFRCFEHGVRCAEGDLSSPGAKTNCVPAEDEGVLVAVADYAAFLDGLKGGAGRVIIGGLSPAASPVTVIEDPSLYLLQSLCPATKDYAGTQGWPSVRMHALAERFDAQLGDFCAGDFAAQLAPLAQRIADAYVEE